jgi:hypothetical protein
MGICKKINYLMSKGNGMENIKILDKVNITPEDVREWGYDENMYFMEQDEDLLLYSPYYYPVLIELCLDEKCPKSNFAYSILVESSRGIVLGKNWHYIEKLKQVIATKNSDWGKPLLDWVNYITRLLGYLQIPFVVSHSKALSMGRDLLVGFNSFNHKEDVRETNRKLKSYWEIVFPGIYPKYLCINKRTGEFVYNGSTSCDCLVKK